MKNEHSPIHLHHSNENVTLNDTVNAGLLQYQKSLSKTLPERQPPSFSPVLFSNLFLIVTLYTIRNTEGVIVSGKAVLWVLPGCLSVQHWDLPKHTADCKKNSAPGFPCRYICPAINRDRLYLS